MGCVYVYHFQDSRNNGPECSYQIHNNIINFVTIQDLSYQWKIVEVSMIGKSVFSMSILMYPFL